MPTNNVSKQFKKQAYKTILAILFFMITYMLLFLLAIGIFILTVIAAKFLVTSTPSFVTIMLGLGLIGVGFFILYFVIKFLFTKNKSNYSNLTEINIHNEPELQKMIQELVDEIGTQFPKKIYVSPEVNASVFYDSSFWSMFFPVRKNLMIGLGLVNTSTVTELKGILAHEFGHFSQKSMKVGSFVYNVNRIIYNLLYDNNDYNNAVGKWSSRSGYFAVLMYIVVAFNKFTQHVLQFVYKIVNINYTGLSLEMEFHADEIATNVVGSQPMINSMLRMDLSSNSFEKVITYYNTKIEKSITTKNIFPKHLAAINFEAKKNKIEIINNLPNVQEDYAEKFNHSKLTIKNQWASHPSSEERVIAFRKLNIVPKDIDNRSANVLFKDITALQELVTLKMFENVDYPDSIQEETTELFLKSMEDEYNEIKLPESFNGYYDYYTFEAIDIDKLVEEGETEFSLEQIFGNDNVELVFINNSQINDLETLKHIASKNYKIKTFDYEGKKYNASQAQSIIDNLSITIADNTEALRKNDIEAFKFFYSTAKAKNEHFALLQLYKEFSLMYGQYDTKEKIYMDMHNEFAFAYQELQVKEIQSKIFKYDTLEEKFKEELRNILKDQLYENAVTFDLKVECIDYLNKDLVYFDGKYDDEAINIKNRVLGNYIYILQQAYFLKKKELLDFQDKLINTSK